MMSKCAWKLCYKWQLGLTPILYSHNDVNTASYNFCTSFGQEVVAEDVAYQMGIAALVGSSYTKQGRPSTSKFFTSFRTNNIIKHMREQHGQNGQYIWNSLKWPAISMIGRLTLLDKAWMQSWKSQQNHILYWIQYCTDCLFSFVQFQQQW